MHSIRQTKTHTTGTLLTPLGTEDSFEYQWKSSRDGSHQSPLPQSLSHGSGEEYKILPNATINPDRSDCLAVIYDKLPDFAFVLSDKEMLFWAPFSEYKLQRRATSWTWHTGQKVQHGRHLSLHQLRKHQNQTLPGKYKHKHKPVTL